jgi:DNA topoisomerase I
LGNTAAVCSRSYIHPAIVKSYLGGAFVLEVIEETGPRNLAGLTAEEAAVLSLLRSS